MTSPHERAQVLSDAFQELGYATVVVLHDTRHCVILYLMEAYGAIPLYPFGHIVIYAEGEPSASSPSSLNAQTIRNHLEAMGIPCAWSRP